MRRQIETVEDVVRWRLCVGCGACAYLHPEAYEMRDWQTEGIRPVRRATSTEPPGDALAACPARTNDRRARLLRDGIIPVLKADFGPVLELYEGHAADPEIRFAGSSGGALTALSLFCVERLGMHGVLHTSADPRCAYRNATRLSRSRAEMLAATGSRYAPGSVCADLGLVERAPRPCVVVGQPSEITALSLAMSCRPSLAAKVGLTLSFFCAGSPSTAGTLDLLRSKGIDPDEVAELRYRGRGWPGHFSVRLKGQERPVLQLTYAESWGFVQAYRPFAVHMFPDGSGEDADIACGDPWHLPTSDADPGQSILLARTERGRTILRQAAEAGYLRLVPSDPRLLLRAQRNLAMKMAAIWGRSASLRLAGLPAPRIRGYGLFAKWLRLPAREKLRSTLGTLRRIVARGYRQPMCGPSDPAAPS